MTQVDMDYFRGKKLEQAKTELESLGYTVNVILNSRSKLDSKESLVVLARLTNDKEVELVVGEFKFLS